MGVHWVSYKKILPPLPLSSTDLSSRAPLSFSLTLTASNPFVPFIARSPPALGESPSPSKLEKEIRDGTWYVAEVSKDVLFKSRDRLGTKRAKPLWADVMELMGGKYEDIRNRLYES